MQYANIKGVNQKLSRFVMGTFGMNLKDPEPHFKRLDAAVELGVNVLDTAQAYGSEPFLGEWMRQRKNRKDLVIISKGAHPTPFRDRVTTFDITSDLHDSLAMLGVDQIDIYLLHRDNPTLPVGPIVELLNQFKREGKIGIFGGSNWTHQRIEEANRYAAEHGLEGFTVSSPHFSLADQIGEPWAPGCVAISGPNNAEAREWYTKNQMPVFAYSSVAHGFFSGRVTREKFEKDPEVVDQFCRAGYCFEPNFKRLDRVIQLAKEKGVSVPQIAVAFILHSKMNVFPLIGGANAEEIKSSIDSGNIKLVHEELDWIDLLRDER